MKRYVLLIISILFLNIYLSEAQGIPEDVRVYLDSLREDARKKLTMYRVNPEEGELYINLRYRFDSYYRLKGDSELFSKAENLNLNIGMIYDEPMRQRIMALMRNEYEDWELDTLVNRYLNRNIDTFTCRAIDQIQPDTSAFFRMALDSVFAEVVRRNSEAPPSPWMKKNYIYETFLSLQLDTTAIFRQLFAEKKELTAQKVRERYLAEDGKYFQYTLIAKLCGYIGDPRFEKLLIEALDKPKTFNKPDVLNALVRMKVEPYYSDYLKKWIGRSQEDINTQEPDFKLDELADIIRTQEAFREISRYLFSEIPYAIIFHDMDQTQVPLYLKAFSLIRKNINNKEMREFAERGRVYEEGDYGFEDLELRKEVYEWMQNNYGKYEIKRLW